MLLDRQPLKVLKEDAVRFYAAEVVTALEYLHCQGSHAHCITCCIHEILLEWWWIIACMSMSMDIHLCPLVSTCVNIR